jgi:AraC family transcriptional regulator, transcriptional activator of pobA
MVTFTETFLKQNFTGDLFQQFPFLLNESTPVMKLNIDIQTTMTQLFDTMIQEYKGTSSFKKAILSNHLSILLFKTKELLQSHQVSNKASGRYMELVNHFKMILNENFKNLLLKKSDKILSIKEIADSMHIHPNYLSKKVANLLPTGFKTEPLPRHRLYSKTQPKVYLKLHLFLALLTAPILPNSSKK